MTTSRCLVAAILVPLAAAAAAWCGDAPPPKTVLPTGGERPVTDAAATALIRELKYQIDFYYANPDTKEGNDALAKAEELSKKILSMDLTDSLSFKLVQEVGHAEFIRWMNVQRLGRMPAIILDGWKRYQRAVKMTDEWKKQTVEKVEETVRATGTETRVRWKNIEQLREFNQFIIPYVVKHLKSTVTDKEEQANARVLAQEMGRTAVLPVIELLDHPDLGVRQNAARILGDIEPFDARAVAPLLALARNDTAEQTLRNNAVTSVQRITGRTIAELSEKPVAEYYVLKADRYFRDESGVQSEREEQEGVIWHLRGEELVYVLFSAPEGDWIWNEIMAEEAILRAFKLDPTYEKAHMLLAANTAKIIAEQADMLDVRKETGAPLKDKMTAQQSAFIDEQEKKMFGYRKVLLACGPKYCYRALSKCLHDRFPETAVVLIEALRQTDRGMLDAAGNMLPPPPEPEANADKRPAAPAAAEAEGWPLIWALNDSDERVRFAAAITLAYMNPVKNFMDAQKVTSVLGVGISKSAPYQVLLVTADNDEKNRYEDAVKKLGYGFSSVPDGQAGLATAREVPLKDLIIISDALKTPMPAKELLEKLATDAATRNVPVAVLTNRGGHAAAKEAFGVSQPSGWVMREEEGLDLKKKIEDIAGAITLRAQRYNVNKYHKDEVAEKCAAALGAIDPKHTFITYDSQVCDRSLLDALENRPEPVRLESIKTLGVWSRDDANILKRLMGVVDVKAKDANSLKVRQAGMQALAKIHPLDPQVRLFAKDMADPKNEPDTEIQYWAAVCYGIYDRPEAPSMGGPTPDQIVEFIKQHRVDKERLEK
jgi:CheY-like chemotaxis protein